MMCLGALGPWEESKSGLRIGQVRKGNGPGSATAEDGEPAAGVSQGPRRFSWSSVSWQMLGRISTSQSTGSSSPLGSGTEGRGDLLQKDTLEG